MTRQTELTLDFGSSLGVVNPMIYGHFSEHIGGVFYDGLWVGEDSRVENIRGFRKALVDSFRRIQPPVLRWPGGCFAETYDWRDGIGPREMRPVRSGWWYNYDQRSESNQVGTHEFMDFCRLVGAQPYVAANMTSLTPLDIRNWMEYCNYPHGSTTLANLRGQNGDVEPFDVEYWGIGNENWGGGGRMSPEMNAREYMRYATVCSSLRGKKRFIMCGANGHDLAWTRRTLQECASRSGDDAPAWGMSLHYYCGTAGAPQSFTEEEWYRQLSQADYMHSVIDDQRQTMDEYDPQRKIAIVVDEWGCWHKDGSGPSNGYNLFEQQSSMRDAVVAAMTLNLFNNRCDVVAMANIAQLCNNLHSLYLAGGEHCVETPNYHVFDLFKTHQGGRQLTVTGMCDAVRMDGRPSLDTLSVSATEKDGWVTLTMVNLDMTHAQNVCIQAKNGGFGGKAEVSLLYADDPHTCNTFENPTAVSPVHEVRPLCPGDTVEVPPASVALVRMRKEY